MQLLLESGAGPNARDERGETPLLAAAFGGRDVVQLLLDYGAEIEAMDDRGCTPLHAAAVPGHGQIAIM